MEGTKHQDKAAQGNDAAAAPTGEQPAEAPKVESTESEPSTTEPPKEPPQTKHREIDNRIVKDMREGFYQHSAYFGKLSLTTPQKLAGENDTFVGQCVRYRMAYPDHRKDVSGEYIIVYTRPLGQSTGAKDDPYTKTYTLSSNTRKITVYGEERAAFGEGNPQNWGRAEITLKSQKSLRNIQNCRLNFDRLNAAENTIVECTASAMQGPEDYQTADLLDWILHEGVNNSQTQVTFGVKLTNGLNLARGFYEGFYYIVVKLPFFNIEINDFDTQLIVGVKVPSRRDVPDIVNTELYNQVVDLPVNFNSFAVVQPAPGAQQKVLPILAPRPAGSGEASGSGMIRDPGEGSKESKASEPTKFVWKTVTAKSDSEDVKGKGKERVVDDGTSGEQAEASTSMKSDKKMDL